MPNRINTWNHDQAGIVLQVGGMAPVTHVIEEVRELAAGKHKDYLERATPAAHDACAARMGG